MLEWDVVYSVGNQEIDEQHKVWIRILNEIEEIIHRKEFNYLNMLQIVEKLEKFVKFHFEYEENLMIEHSYPQIMEHTNAHNVFRDKLQNTYVLEIEKPKEFYNEMSDYLMKWLADHIMKADKQLGVYLKEQEA